MEIDPKLCPPSGLTGGRGSSFVLDRNLKAYASAADPSEFASLILAHILPEVEAKRQGYGVGDNMVAISERETIAKLQNCLGLWVEGGRVASMWFLPSPFLVNGARCSSK